ncbi:hypothetical protein [uncultured Phenylobacterium sp.]|uniref:hypothetical protein n=1 Tax=uncultured Phenylobacterium sp. TaxID=349273 RepID=UPI0025EFD1D7|nr:hypothetical protein [uncultured Phenylobacterium sp.]
MRLIPIAALAAVLAAPVLAQGPTTLQAVTTEGIVMKAYGMEFPVTYKPDGAFSATVGGNTITGTWRIDGERLCTRVEPDPEVCAAYPAGKRSGDTFDVPGAMGPQVGVVSVRIN